MKIIHAVDRYYAVPDVASSPAAAADLQHLRGSEAREIAQELNSAQSRKEQKHLASLLTSGNICGSVYHASEASQAEYYAATGDTHVTTPNMKELLDQVKRGATPEDNEAAHLEANRTKSQPISHIEQATK